MDEFQDNHLLHSAVLGSFVGLLVNRKAQASTAITVGSVTAVVAYLYMKKHGHTLPQLPAGAEL